MVLYQDIKDVEYKKIKLSQFEEILNNYRFIHGDFSEGLNYGVSDERFEEDGAYLAKHFKVTPIELPVERTSESYLKFIWHYLKNNERKS